MTSLSCAIFFLSGLSALIFETIWFRQAGLAFGNGVWASSLVLSSFMAGIGLGNGLSARFGGRSKRPLRLYAGLELLVGVTGVALVFLLPLLTPMLAPVFRSLWDTPWLVNLTRLGTAFLLMLLPSAAMGATLPLLVRRLVSQEPNFGLVLGRLYGWNTLGAVLGALAGDLFLIERFGIAGASLAAGFCNLVAVGIAIALSSRVERPGSSLPPEPAHSVGSHSAATRLLLAAFGSGFVLLALEVVWFLGTGTVESPGRRGALPKGLCWSRWALR